ncbi:MAG: hypothetical protein ABR564_08160 [Candidatus Dormibacteria bacterium]
MLITIEDLAGRIEAACFAALAAEAAASGPAAADDFLLVAESLGAGGRLDVEDLRRRGLGGLPLCGEAGILLRALPLALLSPLDRPSLRRDAQRCAALAMADEGTVVTSVAAALLTADLLRFDLDTALIRVRQSLLEEAPIGLLQRLTPLQPTQALMADEDPSSALQMAVTALDRGQGVPDVLGLLTEAPDPHASLTLGAVLAAVRDGLAGSDDSWLNAVPHRARASLIARGLAEHAVGTRDT